MTKPLKHRSIHTRESKIYFDKRYNKANKKKAQALSK